MAIVDGHIRCCDCEEVRPVAAFSPSTVAKGCGRCRECSARANREANKRDPGRFKGYRKTKALKNPDAQRTYSKRWAAKKAAKFLVEGPSKAVIRCSTCAEEKPAAEFQPSVAMRGCGVCRACKQVAKRDYARRNPEKVNAAAKARRSRDIEGHRAKSREHYGKNREMYRGYNLLRYGITPAQYDAMLAEQGGRCKCCGATGNRSGKRLFVDHDHATGAVRGLLCNSCNRGIGSLGDTIEGVRRALAYLERAQQPAPRALPAMRINLLKEAN